VAFVLNIPRSRIRIVNVVAGSTQVDFEVMAPPAANTTTTNGTTTASAAGNSTATDGGNATASGVLADAVASVQTIAELANVAQTLAAAATDGTLESVLDVPIEGMAIAPPPQPPFIAALVSELAASNDSSSAGLLSSVLNVTTGADSAAGSGSNSSDSSGGSGAIVLGKGAFGFAAANFTVWEDGGAVTVTIVRASGTFTSVSVSFAAVAADVPPALSAAISPARPGVDFTAQDGVVVAFASGQSRATVQVPVLVNGVYDKPPRAFRVVLSAPTGGATLDAGSAAGTSGPAAWVIVTNVDAPSTVDVANAAAVRATTALKANGTSLVTVAACVAADAAGAVTLVLARSGNLKGPATASLAFVPPASAAALALMAQFNGEAAVAGTDFPAAPGSVVAAFGDGEATATVALPYYGTDAAQPHSDAPRYADVALVAPGTTNLDAAGDLSAGVPVCFIRSPGGAAAMAAPSLSPALVGGVAGGAAGALLLAALVCVCALRSRRAAALLADDDSDASSQTTGRMHKSGKIVPRMASKRAIIDVAPALPAPASDAAAPADLAADDGTSTDTFGRRSRGGSRLSSGGSDAAAPDDAVGALFGAVDDEEGGSQPGTPAHAHTPPPPRTPPTPFAHVHAAESPSDALAQAVAAARSLSRTSTPPATPPLASAASSPAMRAQGALSPLPAAALPRTYTSRRFPDMAAAGGLRGAPSFLQPMPMRSTNAISVTKHLLAADGDAALQLPGALAAAGGGAGAGAPPPFVAAAQDASCDRSAVRPAEAVGGAWPVRTGGLAAAGSRMLLAPSRELDHGRGRGGVGLAARHGAPAAAAFAAAAGASDAADPARTPSASHSRGSGSSRQP
jgi:hypothetical protein